MSEWARDRARWAARAAGLTGPVSVLAAAGAFRQWLEPLLEVRTGPPRSLPLYQARRDGGARITLPATADERQEAEWLLEEISHHLCRGGYPGRPAVNPILATEEELTLDQLREQDEERQARIFMDALLLPEETLRSIRSHRDAEELRWEYGWDEEIFDRRRRETRKGALGVRTPPPWSAWPRYRLEHVEAAGIPRLRILAVDAGMPPIELPVRAAELPALAERVQCDLAALLPHEFRLLYAVDALPAGRPVGRLWEEFAAAPRRPGARR